MVSSDEIEMILCRKFKKNTNFWEKKTKKILFGNLLSYSKAFVMEFLETVLH